MVLLAGLDCILSRFLQIRELKNESENNKKICEAMRMEAEEQIILLRQQIVALRKALTDAQKEANDVKKQLDKEVNELLTANRTIEFIL